MKLLVVYAHPVPTSFNAAIRDTAERALTTAGHDVRVIDLYAENFDPVLSRADREDYLDNTETLISRAQPHVDNLRWAEGLVFIFPTWYYGVPAILKGWFERVWLPTVTFFPAEKKGNRPSSCIRKITRLVVITTSGSPRWWMILSGNSCRRFFTRGLRVLFNKRCKTTWLQLYEMNVCTMSERKKFLSKVENRLARI